MKKIPEYKDPEKYYWIEIQKSVNDGKFRVWKHADVKSPGGNWGLAIETERVDEGNGFKTHKEALKVARATGLPIEMGRKEEQINPS